MLRTGEWKATTEGTREKVQTHRRDKAPLLGRGGGRGHHRILLEPQRVLACQLAELSQCIPSPPSHVPGQKLPTIHGGLAPPPFGRHRPSWLSVAGLLTHRKCPTPVEQAAQHHQPSGRALQPRDTRVSPAQPRGVHLHHEKEKHKQDEEVQKPFPVKGAGELT